MPPITNTSLLRGFGAETVRALCARGSVAERSTYSRIIVFADQALLGTPPAEWALEALRQGTRGPLVRPTSGPPELDAVLADAGLLQNCSAAVALGGGSVIDHAKLVRAAAAGADLRSPTKLAAGHVPLVTAPSHVPLIALPTTLGTGSERNTNAILAAGGRRFLVSGDVLRPDVAVLDADFTRSLSTNAILSGIYEALARTIEPHARPTAQLGADQLALATAARLAVLGDEISVHRGEPVADDVLFELARLSGLSHAPAMHAGRSAFAFPGWFLAHELATVTGTSKVSCLRALLPVIDRRAHLGVRAWGSARRRTAASNAVLTAVGLPSEIESALSVLATRWSLAVPSTDFDVDALSARILAAWGPPSPHLTRIGHRELVAVLNEVKDTGSV